MSWRVVVVSSNAKVDYKMDYLVVRTLDETKRIHISEIAVLMLESTAVSLTAYAVCELLAHKVKVIFCDKQRNPYGEVLPTTGSHDSTAKIRQQIGWKKNTRFRKHLIRNGFIMVQESVYAKLALNMSAAGAIMEAVRREKPPAGLVQMLVITEKQYTRMEYVVGERSSEIIDSDERTIYL